MRKNKPVIWILASIILVFYAASLLSAQTPEQIFGGEVHPDGNKTDTPVSSNFLVNSGEDLPGVVAGTVRVNSWLNVRTSPWGKRIGKLINGEKISILGIEGDWYKIQWNGQTAFIHSEYVNSEGGKGVSVSVNQGPRKQNNVTPAKNDSASSIIRETIVSAKPASIEQTAGANSASEVKNDSVSEGRFGAEPCTPMPKYTTTQFGPKQLYGRTFHNGIDFTIPSGTRLNALGDGKVIASGFDRSAGNYLKIRYDNGLVSMYCHLKSATVKVGTRVSIGQQVALSDNTGISKGAHLHLSILKDGKFVDPRLFPEIPIPPKK